MRSTDRLTAESGRLRACVEAFERLAAETRLRTWSDAPVHGDSAAAVELDALAAVAQAAAEAKDAGSVMRSVEHALARALDTRMVRILLAEADGTFTVAHATAVVAGIERVPGSAGLAGRVLARQAALRTSACAETCRQEGVAPSASPPAEPHALFAPLLAGGQAIGVIEIWRRTRPFSGADEYLVTMLGGLLALALRVISPSAR
jgi:GAF domain-containing protein